MATRAAQSPSDDDWWTRRPSTSRNPVRAVTNPSPATHDLSPSSSSSSSSPFHYPFFTTVARDTAPRASLFHHALADPDDEDADLPDLGPSSPAALFLSGFVSPPISRSSSAAVNPPPPPARPNQDPDTIGGYTLGKTIAHGGFSTIRLATSVLTPGASPTTAVKIVRKFDARPGASEARSRLSREASIWKQLSHEHILPLFHEVETDYATYLFTLYCPAGSLLDILNAHSPDGGLGMDDAGMLFRQLVRGLRYLHETVGLVHSDLKLENVLVDDTGSCRISDFGLARWIASPDTPVHTVTPPSDASSDEEPPSPFFNSPLAVPSTSALTRKSFSSVPVHLSLRRVRGRRHRPSEPFGPPSGSQNAVPTHPQHTFPPGSLPYASPEMLTPSDRPLVPSPSQDMWALGCILYALLFGKLPFNDPFEPRLQMKIVRGVWHFPGHRSPSRGSRSRTRCARSISKTPGRSRSKSQAHDRRARVGDNPSFRNKSRGRAAQPRRISPRSASQKRIGRVAENVLKGCLCIDVSARWTVSMVDEVGWGVGWDLDVEYEEEEEEGQDVDDDNNVSTCLTSSSSSNDLSFIATLSTKRSPNEPHSPEIEVRGKSGNASRSSPTSARRPAITISADAFDHDPSSQLPSSTSSRSISKERNWSRGRNNVTWQSNMGSDTFPKRMACREGSDSPSQSPPPMTPVDEGTSGMFDRRETATDRGHLKGST